ncbi:tetratricopeptide repeat protein [Streptomyces sp. NPDC059564]|uniref:tetratricopeptide repeat protein n=1 Tax=Streptomyces sp. NPDC059564 TaxID=3346865 RepID=UPI0036762D06
MTGRTEGRASGQGRVYQAAGDQHIVEHHHHGPTWSGPDSVRRPTLGRTPLALRDRVELMQRLRASVEPGTAGQAYVLHGLGGCGKTAVAHAVFEYATADAGRVGLWVNASDTTSLRSGMLAVAADRGAAEGELAAARSGLRAAADLVWDHLDRSDEPWLLVIDNADDPAVLRDGGWLRTSARGTVLVTSRQAAARWWPGAELLQVGVLPREEAAQVLCDLAPGTGTVEQAAAIGDRLGRLPLALTLAGTFLSQRVISPWTMTDYADHLDGGRATDPIELLDQGGTEPGGDSRHLVSRTWELSLRAVADQGLPEAQVLLRLLACWGSDPLPLSLLADAELPPILPAARVEPALRGLLDHSLTELVGEAPRGLRTHGVLLDSVARSTPSDQRGPLAGEAARLLLAALPEQPERGLRAASFSPLAPHVLALLRRVTQWDGVDRSTAERAAESALRLVMVLHRAGDFASALSLGLKAEELTERRLGGEHPLLVRLHQRRGRTLHRLGRFEESETLLRETLALCERVFGPTDPDTLESCIALTHPLRASEHLTEAGVLVRRAVAGQLAARGPVHPLTLRVRSYLPLYPESGGSAVVEMGEELVRDCRWALGPDHVTTLRTEHNFAFALFSGGEPAAALPYARAVLAAFERQYGGDYQITLAARSLLSQILAALGDFTEAVEHARAVAENRARVLGPDHPWTLLAQELLARYQAGEAGAG